MSEKLSVSSHQGKFLMEPTKGSKIAIVCDAYDGDRIGGSTTGVKRTLLSVAGEIEKFGHEVDIVYPGSFQGGRIIRTPCAPEVGLKVVSPKRMRGLLEEMRPDAIFNKTPEGTLGIAASFACRPNEARGRYGVAYTSNYTTNHDVMVRRYAAVVSHGILAEDDLDPGLKNLYNRAIRSRYKGAQNVMAPTEGMVRKLQTAGIEKTVVWPRGVDSNLFRPLRVGEQNAYNKYGWGEDVPVLLYFGRVSKEKSVDVFLSLQTPGYRKVVIGDGPDRERLEKKFADERTHFLGKRYGEDLAHHVRSARLLIFPSRYETFGNVITEAAASGTIPVAYDVLGSGEVLTHGVNGIYIPVGRSLQEGIEPALNLDRQRCAEVTAREYTWERTARILMENLKPIYWGKRAVN